MIQLLPRDVFLIMPAHRGKSTLRKVPLRVADTSGDTIVSGLDYAFRGRIDAAEATALGQVPIDEVAGEGIVFGCNKPKPAKLSKDFSTGTVSSFLDEANRTAAYAAQWYPASNSSLGMQPHDTVRAIAVYTEINGIQYGWFMQKATWAKIGGEGNTLGVAAVKDTDRFVCYGCSVPKPARLSLREAGETWSTWGDATTPEASLGNWKVASAPIIKGK